MTTPVIAFFNNKGGAGKTSLVYHVAWMCSDLGMRVVAADLDPQANLTAAFLEDERLEELWPDADPHKTIFGCLEPMKKGVGDIGTPYLEYIGDSPQDYPLLSAEKMALLPGDLALSGFEDELSQQWPKCLDRDERAFRVVSSFWRILQRSSQGHKMGEADIILMDLGPNLGAINRAALIASDYVVVPLSPDLFSLQGLRNLGPTLRRWREDWRERLERKPTAADLDLPPGSMTPIGYIVLQHSVRLDRPVRAYDRWIAQIPGVYRNEVLDKPGEATVPVGEDPHCLALLKHYRSLMPLAHEARKPLFHLKPADGAIGAHFQAVRDAREDFKTLTEKILARAKVPVPQFQA